MITYSYKNFIKCMLMYTTGQSNFTNVSVARDGNASTFAPLNIKSCSNNTINVSCINLGYYSSYSTFPWNVSLTKTADYQYGTGFIFLKETMEEDPAMYQVASTKVINNNYLTINSIKPVKRYDSTDESIYLDYYIELKNTDTTPVTIAGIGFQQRIAFGSYDQYNRTTPDSNMSILIDYTNLPEPVTVTNLHNETITYSIKMV